jgi:hypothetical protein
MAEPTNINGYVPRRNGVGGNKYYKGRLGTQGGAPAYYAGPGAGGQKEGGYQPVLTNATKQRVLESLLAGNSMMRVGRLYGIDTMTVSRIAQENNLDTVALASTRRHEARRDYSQIERLRVINLAFERIEDMLDDDALTARDLKDLTIAMGISIDKRRLEDGQATERTEISDLTGARNAVRNKLLEIAERRKGLAPGTLMRELESVAREVAPIVLDRDDGRLPEPMVIDIDATGGVTETREAHSGEADEAGEDEVNPS